MTRRWEEIAARKSVPQSRRLKIEKTRLSYMFFFRTLLSNFYQSLLFFVWLFISISSPFFPFFFFLQYFYLSIFKYLSFFFSISLPISFFSLSLSFFLSHTFFLFLFSLSLPPTSLVPPHNCSYRISLAVFRLYLSISFSIPHRLFFSNSPSPHFITFYISFFFLSLCCFLFFPSFFRALLLSMSTPLRDTGVQKSVDCVVFP